MDKLLAKMKEVGYDKFNMGLPGNLITVALKDYVHKAANPQFGGGLPDNSDGFQNYENGGATGRKEEADRILFAMLGEYDRCGFEGRDAKGRSPDWRRWDGTATGGEGYWSTITTPCSLFHCANRRLFGTAISERYLSRDRVGNEELE